MDIKRITIKNRIYIKKVDVLFKKFLKEESVYNENYRIMEELNSFEQDLYNENNIMYICKYGNNIVAFLYGYINQTKSELNPVAHLAYVYVENNFRNKKIASNLIDKFFNEIQDKKINIVEVNCFYNNEAAKKLYQKYGFTENYINYRKIIQNGVVKK